MVNAKMSTEQQHIDHADGIDQQRGGATIEAIGQYAKYRSENDGRRELCECDDADP